MLKKSPSHPPNPGAPKRAVPQAAFSHRSETQRTEAYAFVSSLAAALLDGHVEHPVGYSDTIPMRNITTEHCTKTEFFRSLLADIWYEGNRVI
jgi:hypothetical protein